MNFKKRIQALQKLIKQPVLVSDPRDVFYYSGYQVGTDDSPLLLVGKAGKPTLFLSPLTGAVEAYAGIVFFKRVKELLELLPQTIGIDEYHMPAKLFLEIKKKGKVVSCSSVIKKPREIKDEGEIERMRKAIRIDKKVLERLDFFNKKEKDIAQEIERGFYEHGAVPAFETIVASGPNSGNYIHHFPGNRLVRRKEMVIIDFGARFKGYSSDVTRTYFFKNNKRQKEIFETVKNLQEECIEMVKPGIDFKEINYFYKRSLQKKGFAVRHGIGHGLGIFVHEPAQKMQKGMVVTIEPGIYLRNFGGCRIEDVILVGTKPEVLSRSIPQLR